MRITTKLAEDMGVVVAPGMAELSKNAKARLNIVLRALDEDEASSLFMMGAVGPWDWHLLDGTGRVWHLTTGGSASWNECTDRTMDLVIRQATAAGWEQREC